MKIVVDGFGGDFAPFEVVEGCVLAIKKYPELEIIVCGDEKKIKEILNGREERIQICDAKEIITNDDVPTEAIRRKKDSSLVRAFDVLKENEDVIALVSNGSTGAILTGAIMKIGRIRGISRPAIAPILPTRKESDVILLDSGANIDCKPLNLYHFGIMGSCYFSALYNVENPRVGILNIGVEEHKGTDLVREGNALLKEAPINFIGNIEAREYMSGDVDVLVAEGFAGNVLLKGSEGAVAAILSIMKAGIKSSFMSKIGYLFMKKTFGKIKDKVDISKHGGSPLLGCKKIVMKNHGSSKRSNILASIDQAITLHENKLIEKISNKIQSN